MSEHEFAFLTDRIRLRERHLREWETLIASQQRVWRAVDQEISLKLTFAGTDSRARSALIHNQADQLQRMMIEQSQVREQLKEQQRDQKVKLNQLYEP